MGCFGAPLTDANKKRYVYNHTYNKQIARTKMINSATSDTFGFDCVNLIKGILWGWNGDKSKTYGGATYCTNGVPDVNANTLIKMCKDLSKDFTTIVEGELVWIEGHVGVYIGKGKVVECSPKWENGVQISYLGNIKEYAKGNNRTWLLHGKLPFVDYSTTVSKAETSVKKSNSEIAREVIQGKWGVGAERKQRLTVSGYNYKSIQTLVNKMLKET